VSWDPEKFSEVLYAASLKVREGRESYVSIIEYATIL
jgi:hypothetical protein